MSDILAALAKMASVIKFEEKGHKYTLEGEEVPSSTTILEKVLSKPVLVPWAAKVQWEKDTGIIREWLEKSLPGQLASPGNVSVLWKTLEGAKQYHRKVSKEGRDIGKEAHALIEHHCKGILGLPTEKPKVSDEATHVFMGWMEWAAEVGFEPLAVECRVWGVAGGRKYSGTFDAIGKFKKLGLAVALADWKSSNGIYFDMLLQVESYARTFPDPPTAVIVRLPKYTVEKPEVRWVPRDDKAFECFAGLLQSYSWVKENSK